MALAASQSRHDGKDPVEVIRRYVTEVREVKKKRTHRFQNSSDQRACPHDDRNCVSVVLDRPDSYAIDGITLKQAAPTIWATTLSPPST